MARRDEKDPVKSIRNRSVFTRSEMGGTPAEDAQCDNPWDRMLQHDDRWNRHGTRRLPKVDLLTVLVLLGVGALIISAVLLMR